MEELELALNIVKDKYGNYYNFQWHLDSMMNYGIVVLNEIKKNSPNLDILDAGFGWGTISIASHIMDNNITSIDLFCPPPVFYGINWIYPVDIQDPDFELEQRFDYILLLEVLEHFNFNVKPTLKKLVSWLKEDGILIITTPDKERFNENLPDIILPEYDKNIKIKDSHIRFYDENDLSFLKIESTIELNCHNMFFIRK